MGNEVFSEQQVQQILKRAVELHEKSQATPYTPGITRDELQRIADELGVSTVFLEQAIADNKAPETRSKLTLTKEFEEVVEGELSPDNFDVLTPMFYSTAPNGGPRQVGRSLQAQTWAGLGYANVEVTSRNGRTKIKAKSSPLGAMLIGAYPALVAAIIGSASLGGAGHAHFIPAVWAAAVAAGTLGFRGVLKAGHDSVGNLVQRMKDAVIENKESPLIEENSAEATTEEIQQRLNS